MKESGHYSVFLILILSSSFLLLSFLQLYSFPFQSIQPVCRVHLRLFSAFFSVSSFPSASWCFTVPFIQNNFLSSELLSPNYHLLSPSGVLTPLLPFLCCFSFPSKLLFQFPVTCSFSSSLTSLWRPLLDNRPPHVVRYSSSVCLSSSLMCVCVLRRHRRSRASQCIFMESKYQTPLLPQSQDTTLSAFMCLLDLLPGLFTGWGWKQTTVGMNRPHDDLSF